MLRYDYIPSDKLVSSMLLTKTFLFQLKAATLLTGEWTYFVENVRATGLSNEM